MAASNNAPAYSQYKWLTDQLASNKWPATTGEAMPPRRAKASTMPTPELRVAASKLCGVVAYSPAMDPLIKKSLKAQRPDAY